MTHHRLVYGLTSLSALQRENWSVVHAWQGGTDNQPKAGQLTRLSRPTTSSKKNYHQNSAIWTRWVQQWVEPYIYSHVDFLIGTCGMSTSTHYLAALRNMLWSIPNFVAKMSQTSQLVSLTSSSSFIRQDEIAHTGLWNRELETILWYFRASVVFVSRSGW